MFASIMCSGHYGIYSSCFAVKVSVRHECLKHKSSVMFAARRTHCGEFVRRDFFLALCDGVEEQVLQAGQDACLPSPAGKKNKNTQTEK